jgi:spiro-SPASM protein
LIPIMDLVLENPFIKELVIETALYPDITALVNYLKEAPDSKKRKLIIIINLTTLKEQIYKDIYGRDLLGSILEKISLIKPLIDKKNFYVQMLKIKEIEAEIEEYFNYFEKLDIQVLLQKYNSYANRMQEKRVSNLTPIQRDFCWHLARDLYIQSNGDVTACKQVEDVVLGNIKKQPILDIWNQNTKRFESSFNQKHSDIDLPCLKCDEWYTFNA